jgi:hypothetical protein
MSMDGLIDQGLVAVLEPELLALLQEVRPWLEGCDDLFMLKRLGDRLEALTDYLAESGQSEALVREGLRATLRTWRRMGTLLKSLPRGEEGEEEEEEDDPWLSSSSRAREVLQTILATQKP